MFIHYLPLPFALIVRTSIAHRHTIQGLKKIAGYAWTAYPLGSEASRRRPAGLT